MKIVIVANPNLAFTLHWCDNFVSLGHELHLIGDHRLAKGLPQYASFHNLPAKFNIRGIRYIYWLYTVQRIIQVIKPDILHALGAVSAGWLATGSSFHPRIVTALGSDLLHLPNKSPIFRKLTKYSLQKSDLVMCVSSELAQITKSMGVSSDHIRVSISGIDLEVFYPVSEQDQNSIRNQLKLANDPTVLSIRALTQLYNPVNIIQTIPHVLHHIPNVQYLFHTYNQDPKTRLVLEDFAHKAGIENNVEFLSPSMPQEMIADYYRSADVGISVPSSDGTPVSVLECMACGTPVILSNLPSLHDWVDQYQDGIFIQTNNIIELSDAIINILQDRQRRRILGSFAAERIRQYADKKIWLNKNEALYQELIDKRL